MRRRSPLLGVIVPLALLLGQFSTVLHLMLVEHERCREHGELVHRTLERGANDAPPERALAVAANAAGTAGGDARIAGDGAAEGHGHEHCLSLTNRRDGLRLPEQPAATTFAPPARPLTPATTPSRLASVAILHLAPKTSPPPATAIG